MVCHLKESSSTFVNTLMPEDLRPSVRTPLVWMYQRSPFLVHTPSEVPPSESKTQERILLSAASQPMIWTPDMLIWSPTASANERRRKFRFLVHSQSVSIVAFSSLSIQEPTSHSRSFSCS